jgi:hypothetical protein
MANTRKPTPKTQNEISREQHVATSVEYGNPNNRIKPNRSQQVSWKDDNVKPFTVGIQDIDEAVFYYFDEVIKPTVFQNGQRLPVPVIYGSPEKWKSYQKDGYYRDLKGAIMAPLIMFKRDSLDKNRTIANKLDANNPNNYSVSKKHYDPRNEYNQFNVLNNRKPEIQYYATVVPDYVTITYSCAVFTYYVEQLNKIVEAIEYASDAYWGDPERYKFKTMIDTFGFQTELTQDNERVVRSTFNIKLNGYIVPNTIQKDLTAISKFSNTSQVLISETVVNKVP